MLNLFQYQITNVNILLSDMFLWSCYLREKYSMWNLQPEMDIHPKQALYVLKKHQTLQPQEHFVY